VPSAGNVFRASEHASAWGKTAQGDHAALLAAGLFGFNPVAVYFAGEVMDVTIALALALGGMYAALLAREAVSGRAAMGWGSAAAVGWGLASAARPNYLPLMVAGPIFLSLTVHAGRRRVGLACAAAGLVVVLAAGCVQWAHCGQFRVLPWQGAYNLWAANKPGANGKYFAQEVTHTG
jgi:4-amino-4-deoxy-L-arabinose transferase-like glycosyltransferase